ncbi:MAG TPA: hypothetical protein VFI47_17560 [Acidimicrobiales bacterium]|nr:hypothetical protein [Acidimicrobiales bacterium]
MSKPQQQRNGGGGGRRRRAKGKAKHPVDLWHPVPPLPAPEPITPASDPTALVRSLGDPPLPAARGSAEITIATVVDRAAGLATALAAIGGLLDESDDTPDSPDAALDG